MTTDSPAAAHLAAVRRAREEHAAALPLNHYEALYRSLDPGEIARRCGLSFDGGGFGLRVMGEDYRVGFPEFRLTSREGVETTGAYEKILFIRYLCEGVYAPPTPGKRLSYREIPWGNVYYRNFEGRCLSRLARTFGGGDLEAFRRAVESAPGLRAEPLDRNGPDFRGYRFEFCTGLYMSALLWAADDEFPAQAQMLFDDNFPGAFTAEDIAVVGELVLSRLKAGLPGERGGERPGRGSAPVPGSLVEPEGHHRFSVHQVEGKVAEADDVHPDDEVE